MSQKFEGKICEIFHLPEKLTIFVFNFLLQPVTSLLDEQKLKTSILEVYM